MDDLSDRRSKRGVDGSAPVFVSLSGGVDSMVLTQSFCFLRRFDSDAMALNIVAVHIDYGNRTESHREALFLRNGATNAESLCASFQCAPSPISNAE